MHFTYCPHCGTQAVLKQVGDEGEIPYCVPCKLPLWDLFTTCVICAVVNEENEIALLRQDYVSTSHYVCVAGVMKLGESAEESAIREIKEEIGLSVERLQYIESYPFVRKEMLMLGYKAYVKKAEFIISREVNSAEWVALHCALEKLKEGSIAWLLVNEVIKGT